MGCIYCYTKLICDSSSDKSPFYSRISSLYILDTGRLAVGEGRSWGLAVRRGSLVGSVAESVWVRVSSETVGIRGVAVVSVDGVLKSRVRVMQNYQIS